MNLLCKKQFIVLVFCSVALTLFFSCDKKSDPDKATTYSKLDLSFTNLVALQSAHQYEAWLIVDEKPVSIGRPFNVADPAGKYTHTISFDTDAEKANLSKATAFVLSIEPNPDTDPKPSDVKILAGTFSGTAATVSIDHANALGVGITDKLSKTKLKYILATPTTAVDTDETSGIWFLDNSADPSTAGITDLPTLPTGWKYEAWLMIKGNPLATGFDISKVVPLSMGKFTSAGGKDESSPYSGSVAGPAYPGEDFVANLPAGLATPYVITISDAIAITVEKEPDYAPTHPSPLVVFGGAITNLATHKVVSNGVVPVYSTLGSKGTATKK